MSSKRRAFRSKREGYDGGFDRRTATTRMQHTSSWTRLIPQARLGWLRADEIASRLNLPTEQLEEALSALVVRGFIQTYGQSQRRVYRWRG
jgi:predicted ArsR family transcriptional regulator